MIEKHIGFELKEIYIENERCIGGNCPLNKIASENSTLMDTVHQKKDHAYFHVIAMGAGDYYNENNNGDFFYEKDLKDYFHTFNNAGIFIQHDNKDPNKSLGKVKKAIYNEGMHRIELILEVSKEKAPSIYKRAANGERLSVSMGVKVPKESCSYCGSITQGSLSNRCDHLKFMMHKQMDNGQVVYAINHPPMNFFDISFVSRPADTQGHSLFTKVAGHYIEETTNNIDKIAELIKYVESGVMLPRPKKEELDALKVYGPHSIPKVMAGDGIFILPSEALYLMDLIEHSDIEEASKSVDTEVFVRKLYEKFGDKCGCPERSGSVSVGNKELRGMQVRTNLLKEAGYVKGDIFGNSFQAQPSVRSKKKMTRNRFSQYKVNFYGGDSLTVNSNVLREHNIPQYYLDLVEAGYAENIMGIMANGNEKIIFTRGK